LIHIVLTEILAAPLVVQELSVSLGLSDALPTPSDSHTAPPVVEALVVRITTMVVIALVHCGR
jgi:hypothetical protein